jgi:hypothetical protein
MAAGKSEDQTPTPRPTFLTHQATIPSQPSTLTHQTMKSDCMCDILQRLTLSSQQTRHLNKTRVHNYHHAPHVHSYTALAYMQGRVCSQPLNSCTPVFVFVHYTTLKPVSLICCAKRNYTPYPRLSGLVIAANYQSCSCC